jgi:hypothetical protein
LGYLSGLSRSRLSLHYSNLVLVEHGQELLHLLVHWEVLSTGEDLFVSTRERCEALERVDVSVLIVSSFMLGLLTMMFLAC